MKNTIFKLFLLLTLVLSLTLSFASCDALLGGDDDGVSDGGTENGSNQNGGMNGDTPTDDAGAHTHVFSEWITTKPAACNTKGELARVCYDCNARESQEIPALDHVYVNGVCSACGHSTSTSGGTSTDKTDEIKDTGKMDSFDYSRIPAFSGAEYVTVNENTPFFTADELVTESYENYGALDPILRCTVATACLGKDIMPTEDRGNISHDPTGWVQATYSCVSGGYLYNRCHLIAWQLAAENNNKQNLITGTRFLNAAMIPFENMIASYIKETENHVMYRVTPVFVGDELLCRGVLIEAYSVEDEGDGISFNVFFYNAQPGVVLDYATGKSRAEGDTNVPDTTPEEHDYVLNTSSKKVHTPTCRYAESMKESNKEYYTGYLEDLIEEGYVAAGCCHPE